MHYWRPFSVYSLNFITPNNVRLNRNLYLIRSEQGRIHFPQVFHMRERVCSVYVTSSQGTQISVGFISLDVAEKKLTDPTRNNYNFRTPERKLAIKMTQKPLPP